MSVTTQSKKRGLLVFATLFINLLTLQSVFATGTPELSPTNTDTISLFFNSNNYYNFGRYESSDAERLYINISNPNSEQVFLGFSQPTTNAHWPTLDRVDGFFRIKDPSGTVVYGPQRLSATTSNISTYDQTVAGPQPLGGTGAYSPFVFDPTGLSAGDYYIEFSRDSLVNSGELLITYFDITVATTGGSPTEIEGRVFSKNWGFFLPSIEKPSLTYSWFDRPFNGRFFVYTEDGFVSDIDFKDSGFQPAAFKISINSSGTGATGNVLEDRKSLNGAQGNTVEYKIFLEEPDINVYPSGVFGSLLTDSTALIGCAQTGYFIKIVTTQQGVIEVLLDQDQNSGAGIYDPNTADVILAVDVNEQLTDDTPGLYTRYIPWNGLDGLGAVVDPVAIAVPVEVTFSQGRYHIPIYDAEYNLHGFKSKVIRPLPPVSYVLKYYYDDSNIPDDSNIAGQESINSEGCVPVDSCHQWNNLEYGDLNTINTYWFAKQEFQSENLTVIEDCGEDRDGDGIFDAVDIDWDNDGIPNDLEYEGDDPTVDSDNDGILNFEDEDFCTLNASGVCANLDHDNDGIPSFLDLDSDNDGIADIIEAGGVDTNNDGVADDLSDADNDGLVDAYDAYDNEGASVAGSATSPDNCQTSDTPSHDIIFNTGITDVTSDVTLTFSLEGDYGNTTTETFSIIGEGNALVVSGYNRTNSDNPTYADCATPGMAFSISISKSLWNAWNSDGTINLVLQASAGVNFCTNRSCISNVSVNYTTPSAGAGSDIPNADSDGDGISDFLDLDADNDGIPDIVEAGGVDTNGDGRVDDNTDTDGDGFANTYDSNCTTDACSPATTGTNIPNEDNDGDGINDYLDLDADNDGIPDLVEANGIDTNGDGRVDVNLDVDQDGLADIFDENAADGLGGTGTNGVSLVETNGTGNWLNGSTGNSLDTDGDGRTDGLDLDADNDGIPDLVETGGSDDDGDGRVDTGLAPWDADEDGLADLFDENAADGPGSDGLSGTALVKTTADTNNDGRVNSTETMIGGGANTVNADTDNLPNHLDLDADNDGIVDILEAGGDDTNGDGLVDDFNPASPNTFDTADNDGWSPTYDGDAANDGNATTTGDGTPLVNTTDTNFDGLPEGYTLGDTDGDSHPDFLDIDADDDGIVDNVEAQDTPGYTLPDNADADGDGIDDAYDNFVGFGGTGIDTNLADLEGTEYDHDSDGVPDYKDNDSDNDNIPDMQEAWDNLADGDSEVDSGVGTCDGSDVDNDGLQDCFDSDTSSPLVTSYQSPINDNGEEGAGTTASTPTSGDDPSEIFPNNDNGDGQPDFRDVLIDCGTPRVYYASTEASAGTTTDYEFDGTTHVDQADTKVVRATTYCTSGDGWLYFFNPLEPENYLFALRNAAGSPNTVPISELVNYVELKVEEDRTNRHVINSSEANLVLERDWNVSLKGTPTPGSTFDVKFYFPPAEMDSLSAAADAVEAMATGTVTREFYWFGKGGGVSNSDITSSGVTGSSDVTSNDPDNITDASSDQPDGTASTSGNGKNYVTFEGLTSLDGGSAGIRMTYNALPVELIRFVASQDDCTVLLRWEAGSEENFSHYDIEKSIDGRNYTQIGQIKGLENTTALNYSFVDEEPKPKTYYRLKMIDLDATFEYSDIIVAKVDCGELPEIKVFPNPIFTKEMLTIELQTQQREAQLVITDLSGRTLKQTTLGTQEGWNSVRMDVSDLPAGTYFMYNQNEQQMVPVKFVVNRF